MKISMYLYSMERHVEEGWMFRLSLVELRAMDFITSHSSVISAD